MIGLWSTEEGEMTIIVYSGNKMERRGSQ